MATFSQSTLDVVISEDLLEQLRRLPKQIRQNAFPEMNRIMKQLLRGKRSQFPLPRFRSYEYFSLPIDDEVSELLEKNRDWNTRDCHNALVEMAITGFLQR